MRRPPTWDRSRRTTLDRGEAWHLCWSKRGPRRSTCFEQAGEPDHWRWQQNPAYQPHAGRDHEVDDTASRQQVAPTPQPPRGFDQPGAVAAGKRELLDGPVGDVAHRRPIDGPPRRRVRNLRFRLREDLLHDLGQVSNLVFGGEVGADAAVVDDERGALFVDQSGAPLEQDGKPGSLV